MPFNFNNTYIQLPEEFYSKIKPHKVKDAQLVFFNEELAEKLNLNTSYHPEELAQIFSGNKVLEKSALIAQAYSGHQFGHFTLLGDGRALLLGEHLTEAGKRFDIQLKGSGITPYSRRGDGKGTLSSMLREFIFSEAMYALGIPSTRSLAVVATGEAVMRDKVHEGGILTRVAQSHIRIGTFQHAQYFMTNKEQKTLLDYSINRHYPELESSSNKALALIEMVIEKQIHLIVEWLRVGFIHGVMNTDNMLISGETIDYGPCAFLNSYTPNKAFSSIDHQGRYAFDQQASIALWNISRFAESLLPLIDKDQNTAINKAQELLMQFQKKFQEKYLIMMGQKLGFNKIEAKDYSIIKSLLNWMEKHQADYTNTFIHLMNETIINEVIYHEESFIAWKKDWKTRLLAINGNKESQAALMHKNNPIYIPRNYLVEEALSQISHNNNPEPLNKLINKVTNPYKIENIETHYIQAPKESYDNNYQTFCGT